MIETCAEACSAAIEANPLSTSDLIEAVEACLVTGVTTPWDWGTLLGGGVGARLIPLFRDPAMAEYSENSFQIDHQSLEEEILIFPSSPVSQLHP